jgi:thiol-disulfide isomerase/thioredoxin
MRKIRIWILTALTLLAISPVNAEPLVIHPFVKGTFASIKQQYQNRSFVLIFWSESCSYCMKELAMFGKLQKQYPSVPLVVVATDPFLEAERVDEMIEHSQLKLQQTWVFAEPFPERIYADVNRRWRGELPVTHFFDRSHKETRHLGIVKQAALEAWLEAQQEK